MVRGWWLVACAGCSTVLGLGDPAPGGAPASCTIGSYDLCANQAAYGPLEFTSDATISTDRDCELVLYQPGTVSACVLYASEIHVAAGVTLTPAGTRSLVLAATGAITIDGTVDASSFAMANTSHIGPGANDPSCSFKRTVVANSSGNGGGAGGTFGGKGGDGGNGAAGAGGLASDVTAAPTFPRGGCPGDGAGSRDTSNGSSGGTGDGGGGLWLASGTSIDVSSSGRLLAGGAGGAVGVGFAGTGQGGGAGGGGGSGGLIHVAAPTITIAGIVAANGGGGGEGSFTGSPLEAGVPGANGGANATPAPGGSGGAANGGDGGNGAAGAVLGGTNGMNSSTMTDSFGGGGGGGAGIIEIVGTAITAGATISPPAQ